MSERFISEIDSLYNFIVKFVDDVINSVTACFVRYFDFEGRSSRAEFWHWQLFRVLLFLSLTFLETVLFSGLNFTFNLFLLIPEISVSIRRLHDWDKSGWFLLLNLIPFVGQLIVFVFMCLNGTVDANRFGPDPKAPSDYEPKLKPLSKTK